ncbi:MAG: M20/M25/M40 family metallo-hydrolase [Bacteroidetes bacterium]|nr:M20/M25/M40 family metallo-hydrolase [Bacteroidota bacterium]
MGKFIFRLILFAFIALAVSVWFKTFRFSSRQLQVEPISELSLNDSLANRFARALKYPTISSGNWVDTSAFRRMDTLLQKQFPLAHKQLDFERVNEFSRIYRWPGTDALLDPVLLIAHLDVVPADSVAWTEGPFSGTVKDGYIWGRGALDDKLSAWALLESVEKLLQEGFQPERSIYLAFGHDEETSGAMGAGSIAARFKEEGRQFAFVLDEGLVILENALDGLDKPVAMIGIAEKGICNYNLIVQLEEGGHAMMPPPETAVGILSAAIDKLQKNPFPPEIDGAVSHFFDYVGPEMSLFQKTVIANRWLTESLLISNLEKDPAANALLRTTIAPTMLRGGVRSNVLPTKATAKVNVRILPGQTIESVRDHFQAVMDDPRVKVQLDTSISYNNPSGISEVDVFGFQLIQRTCLEIYPEVVVAPSLVIGYTDSRQYQDLSDQIYRFCPVQIDRSDLTRIHGIDERLAVDDYLNLIRFYHQLIRESGK